MAGRLCIFAWVQNLRVKTLTSKQYQGMGAMFLSNVSHKTPERREEKKGEGKDDWISKSGMKGRVEEEAGTTQRAAIYFRPVESTTRQLCRCRPLAIDKYKSG